MTRARPRRTHSDRAHSASRRTTRLARRLPLTVLIPRIALLDRPKHGFFQLPQHHIVRVTNRLQLLVEVIERLDRSLVGDLAQGPGDFGQDGPVGFRILRPGNGSLPGLSSEECFSLKNIGGWGSLGGCLFDPDFCPMTGCDQDSNQHIGRDSVGIPIRNRRHPCS